MASGWNGRPSEARCWLRKSAARRRDARGGRSRVRDRRRRSRRGGSQGRSGRGGVRAARPRRDAGRDEGAQRRHGRRCAGARRRPGAGAGRWRDARASPASRADALAQLRVLSGRTHLLHSAAVVVESGERVWGRDRDGGIDGPAAQRRLPRTTISTREYEAIRWNVGGYRIEGLGVQLFEEIEGSHFAILGLPLLPLLDYPARARAAARPDGHALCRSDRRSDRASPSRR